MLSTRSIIWWFLENGWLISFRFPVNYPERVQHPRLRGTAPRILRNTCSVKSCWFRKTASPRAQSHPIAEAWREGLRLLGLKVLEWKDERLPFGFSLKVDPGKKMSVAANFWLDRVCLSWILTNKPQKGQNDRGWAGFRLTLS